MKIYSRIIKFNTLESCLLLILCYSLLDEVEVDDDEDDEEYEDGDEVGNESAEAEAEAARLSARKVEGINRLGELWKSVRLKISFMKAFISQNVF